MSVIELQGLPRPVSSIALGTAVFGTEIPEDEAFAILDTFVEHGGNQIDTANVYASRLPGGEGRSEATLGAWLRSRRCREALVIGTKGGHYAWTAGRESRMNPRDLSHDLEQSLGRLGVDRVDIYWFHRDNPSLPLKELFGWAARQRHAGRIGAIGVSNWSPARVREAGLAARTAGFSSLFGSQVGWSLAEICADRPGDATLVYMDSEGLALHTESRLPVYAFQSQAQGFFSAEGRGSPRLLSRYDTPRNRQMLGRVDAIAALRSVPPTRVALAWFATRPFPAVPIIGPRDRSQLLDSMAALDLNLSPEEAAALAGTPDV